MKMTGRRLLFVLFSLGWALSSPAASSDFPGQGDAAFDKLSLDFIARIYPNGSGDVNQFHAAGGMAFTVATLLDGGLLHRDVMTVGGESLNDYARQPQLDREFDGLIVAKLEVQERHVRDAAPISAESPAFTERQVVESRGRPTVPPGGPSSAPPAASSTPPSR